MEFIEIVSIEEFDYNGYVYDLTIDEDESYNVNNIVVHNSACTTSANVSIHYPMASLISECAYWKHVYDKPTKIIADGGFKNFSDIEADLPHWAQRLYGVMVQQAKLVMTASTVMDEESAL